MSEQIAISVKLFGVLRVQLPAGAERGRLEIVVPRGTSAADVLARYDILVEGAGQLVVLVNGRQVPVDQVLQEGDVLSAFPALAGG
jgi:sulfur carrier protein ThiS